ncbi:hypothetical protein NDU88_002504 [Pleurodeles waltl]|uniref:Uncharacterized protein n=1 Tax=Pleurodeles waltl TaxID=8319 RepID=A0AAV7UXW9_PLEWA|nr:hypothetical protein NDU88_002504 [Pleurodeles waltl]
MRALRRRPCGDPHGRKIRGPPLDRADAAVVVPLRDLAAGAHGLGGPYGPHFYPHCPTRNSEEAWMSPKGRRGRRACPENKPTKAQSAEERTRLLCEATQFVSNPYLALNALTNAEAETNQADSSDTGDSHQGPLLTPRSADDI